MYGLVNKAIKKVVIDQSSLNTWERVCLKSKFDEEDFVGMYPYPDELSIDLISNSAIELNLTFDELLYIIGDYWMTHTAVEGYGDMLNLAGNNFPDFLSNLNMLHHHVQNLMSELRPPHFRVKILSSDTLILTYSTQRFGLISLLLGILKGLGKRFNVSLEIDELDKTDVQKEDTDFKIIWKKIIVND